MHFCRMGHLAAAVRDLLFPPRCVVCDELLPPFRSVILCPTCRTAWDEARMAAAADTGEAAAAGHAYLVRYRSGQTDGVPERLIFHLKHRGDPRAFGFVAASLELPTRVALASTEEPTGDLPLFTYPPRRRAAVRQDGYDQAARLAKALAVVCGGEYVPLLRRTADREQKTLHADERQANAAVSFTINRRAASRVSGRTVVLCDDLCTTGATLTRCEQLLLDAGAAAVVWVTVAYTA